MIFVQRVVQISSASDPLGPPQSGSPWPQVRRESNSVLRAKRPKMVASM